MKRFEIKHNQEEQEPKHFVIRKKFEINNQSQQDSSVKERKEFKIMWHKQENPSDCGPMAILNILIRLNINPRPSSVQQIRDEIATRRLRQNESTVARVGGEIGTTGWLSSSDISSYLRESIGMHAELISNKSDMDQVKQGLINDPKKFYILATNNHFKVVKRNDVNLETFEVLDSLLERPRIVSKDEAFRMLDQSIGMAGIFAG